MPKKPGSRIIIKSCKWCGRLFEQVNPAYGGRPTDFCIPMHKKQHRAKFRKDKVVPIIDTEETETTVGSSS